MGLKRILHRYKPGVSVRTHLFLAALIWSVVGFFLLTNGFVLISLEKSLMVRSCRLDPGNRQDIFHS